MMNSRIRRICTAFSGLFIGSLLIAGMLVPAQAADQQKTSSSLSGKSSGNWRVSKLSGDTWKISWRSPRRLPVSTDRPQIVRNGIPLGTTLVHDRRVVSTVVRSSATPKVTDLDVFLSGRKISQVKSGSRTPGTRAKPSTFEPGELLNFDPATPGPFEVESSDYQAAGVPVAGFRNDVEFVGHVVEPRLSENTGPRGVVLFLHGRHSYCYTTGAADDWNWPCKAPAKEVPSHLGYDYLQKLLASQGYFTVSIRTNGINAQDGEIEDGGASARAKLVRAHLDYWAERATEHKLDLNQVVLVGHSRGGEGVARTAIVTPLSAPYRIVGTVLLAPTDFAGQAVPYVPTVTVLPYCDGDVSDLQGQRYTDIAAGFGTDDNALRSSVLVLGANHNYFNSEWTPGSIAPSMDDWAGDESAECGANHPQRLSAGKQRSVGAAYVAAAVQVFTQRDSRPLAMLDGSNVRVASTGNSVVRTHAIRGGRNMRVPGILTGTTDSTMSASFCWNVYVEKPRASVCGRGASAFDASPHWPLRGEFYPERSSLELSWSRAGQVGGMLFDRELDVSGRTMQLRTAADPARGNAAVKVRLTDATGASADFVPIEGERIQVFDQAAGISRIWAQALSIDPTGAAIDLRRIKSVELVSVSTTGRVWLLDVAAVSPDLAAIPAKRLPLVSLGSAEVAEGNSSQPRTARVPFTLSEPAQVRSTFTVRSLYYGKAQTSDRQTIYLAPGQTKGTIPIEYVGNKTPSSAFPSNFNLTAWAVSGVMMDSYIGSLSIREDDPLPKFKFKAVKKTVKEGQTARWQVSLSAPLTEDAWVEGEIVRGPKSVPGLTGADVPRQWREQVGVLTTKLPLYRQGFSLQGRIKAGSKKFTFDIPIAKDSKREGREQVTMRVSIFGTNLNATRTVYVSPSK